MPFPVSELEKSSLQQNLPGQGEVPASLHNGLDTPASRVLMLVVMTRPIAMLPAQRSELSKAAPRAPALSVGPQRLEMA